MPEEIEVDTEKLREAIHEEIEHEGGAFLKSIALSTTVLAAIAAVAALQAGATVNEALAMKTEATCLQAEASDQWAYYQAKGIKQAVAEAAESAYRSVGKDPPASFPEKEKRYAQEQDEIRAKAKEKEGERDKKTEAADLLLHRHHGFANAVALLQVSIALGAMAALTRLKLVWWGSLGVGAVGIALFVIHMLE
jgi:Domain of unknown function (DUF4337)